MPIKWQLLGPGGHPITDTGSVTGIWHRETACESDTKEPLSGPEKSPLSTLRYDTDEEQFVYNWKTGKKMKGCYSLVLELYGSDQYVLDFQFR